MALQQHIEEIRALIKKGSFQSEAAVSQGIVLRLLSSLEWPTYDIQTVTPEFNLSGRRVDYALCNRPGKPIALIEVKGIGRGEGAERQLFEYAFHVGVQLVILTDGREWNFFLPAEQGDYAERRVYKLDLVERDLNECVFRLSRYLRYGSLTSGTAISAARDDYRDVARQRLIHAALPEAWSQLINDEDDLLIELLADQVENHCGYKPDADTVAAFLKVHARNVAPRPQTPPMRTDPSVHELARNSLPKEDSSMRFGFLLGGRRHVARNARETMTKVFEEFTQNDPSFPSRFAALPKHGRKRRYLAQNRGHLYPGRPDLAADHSIQLSSGWWISTNHSRATINRIIKMACDVVELRYGDDLQVYLGD